MYGYGRVGLKSIFRLKCRQRHINLAQSSTSIGERLFQGGNTSQPYRPPVANDKPMSQPVQTSPLTPELAQGKTTNFLPAFSPCNARQKLTIPLTCSVTLRCDDESMDFETERIF